MAKRRPFRSELRRAVAARVSSGQNGDQDDRDSDDVFELHFTLTLIRREGFHRVTQIPDFGRPALSAKADPDRFFQLRVNDAADSPDGRADTGGLQVGVNLDLSRRAKNKGEKRRPKNKFGTHWLLPHKGLRPTGNGCGPNASEIGRVF